MVARIHPITTSSKNTSHKNHQNNKNSKLISLDEDSLSSSIIQHDYHDLLSDDDTPQVSSSAFIGWLLANSPRGNPCLWSWINGTCCLASVCLLLELSYLEDDDDYDEEGLIEDAMQSYGLPFYALYNFTTTVVWSIEDGLCLFYEWKQAPSSCHHRNMLLLIHAILLVASIYFLVASVLFFGDIMAWRKSASTFTTSMTTLAPIEMEQMERDVFTSFLIYLLALMYVCLWELPRSSTTQSSPPPQQTRNDEAAAAPPVPSCTTTTTDPKYHDV